MEKKVKVTKLQYMRCMNGYTQKELAQLAHMSLRTLQQYETGVRSLRTARWCTVAELGKVLGCRARDLIE